MRDHARQQTEAAQEDKRPRVGRGRPFRRDQRAFWGKDHVEHVTDAFIDVDFGGAFGRIGQIAQDRSDPFDQEGAVGIVRRPVDRTGRLRIGAVEVERDLAALLGHLQGDLVQLWISDAVMLDVVLPGIFAVGDFCQ